MGILLAIILFGSIVIIHELGHFLVAKKNGIVVFEFSLGMGPTLLKKKYGDTVYSLKLLPLGGSCMMGEDILDEEDETKDDQNDENIEEITEIDKEVHEVELRGNFNEKSVWARMAVIFAGPLFNFILAFVLSVIIVLWIGYDTSVIGGVAEGSAAEEAGLQAGDEITELNGKNIHLWREVTLYTQIHPEQNIEVTYERNGEENKVLLEMNWSEESNKYLMGIVPEGTQKAGVLDAFEYGAYTVKYWIDMVVDSLKMIVTGSVGLKDMSGPVGVVDFVDDTYQASAQYGLQSIIYSLLTLTIMLSANLGVMNLLPIPALDGGRLVFLIIEAIRGKRVSPEKEGMVHFIGFALLMILMIVVLFNDVSRIFG